MGNVIFVDDTKFRTLLLYHAPKVPLAGNQKISYTLYHLLQYTVSTSQGWHSFADPVTAFRGSRKSRIVTNKHCNPCQ